MKGVFFLLLLCLAAAASIFIVETHESRRPEIEGWKVTQSFGNMHIVEGDDLDVLRAHPSVAAVHENEEREQFTRE